MECVVLWSVLCSGVCCGVECAVFLFKSFPVANIEAFEFSTSSSRHGNNWIHLDLELWTVKTIDALIYCSVYWFLVIYIYPRDKFTLVWKMTLKISERLHGTAFKYTYRQHVCAGNMSVQTTWLYRQHVCTGNITDHNAQNASTFCLCLQQASTLCLCLQQASAFCLCLQQASTLCLCLQQASTLCLCLQQAQAHDRNYVPESVLVYSSDSAALSVPCKFKQGYKVGA